MLVLHVRWLEMLGLGLRRCLVGNTTHLLLGIVVWLAWELWRLQLLLVCRCHIGWVHLSFKGVGRELWALLLKVIDSLLFGTPDILCLSIQRRWNWWWGELWQRLFFLARIHFRQVVGETKWRSFFIESAFQLLSSLLSGIDIILDIRSKLFYVLIELFIEP